MSKNANAKKYTIYTKVGWGQQRLGYVKGRTPEIALKNAQTKLKRTDIFVEIQKVQ